MNGACDVKQAYDTKPTTKQPPVHEALDMLEKSLSMAHVEFCELQARLECVAPQSPQKETSNPVHLNSCALHDKIADACYRVDSLATALRSLRNRLCV
jgi:hypothetical protein